MSCPWKFRFQKQDWRRRGDEDCRRLQDHNAPQSEGFFLPGICLPILGILPGKKLRKIREDKTFGEEHETQRDRSSRFGTVETASGEDAPFRDAGKDACRKGALIPSRSGYGIKALTTKTMPNINDNFLKLQAGYLFPEIGRRVHAFAESHPEAAKRLIRCGIGDVTEPLPMAAIEAMHLAVDDLSTHERFHGYGPEQGYFWLREAIAKKPIRFTACMWKWMRFMFLTELNATRETFWIFSGPATKSPCRTRFIPCM